MNVAAATQKAIDEGADEIINFGVAGGYLQGAAAKVGDIFEIEKAAEYDFDLDPLNHEGVGVHNERHTPWFNCATKGLFPAATLFSGDSFKNDDGEGVHPTLRDNLPIFIRDMEGAAIAHVCEKNGVKCRMLKCLSDVCDRVHPTQDNTTQYSENLKVALKCLNVALTSWI